jgi:release factor glutamine methyltransferase
MNPAHNPATLAQITGRDQARIATALNLSQSEARLETQVLLAAALNVNRAHLIAHADETPQEALLTRYCSMLERRLAGEPIAYILGMREFYGLTFRVNPDVLIPRPETELLVDLALSHLPDNRPCFVLDLGTGSGAIAIAIAKHRPHTQVIAIDRSWQAVRVAKMNAYTLQAHNVTFIQGDWCAAMGVKIFDIIVANPPYIRENDPHLAQGDLRFEPQSALAAGEDGLASIRQIAADASQHLVPEGWLILEHGYDQAEACRHILKHAGFVHTASMSDLAGIERVAIGLLKSHNA